MDATQLRELIVRPSLEEVGLHSDAAEDLVMGTAAQESHLMYVKQLGGGPALSLFQIEPATYKDYWDNYLTHRVDLIADIQKSCGFQGVPEPSRLIWDLKFASIMCRVHYRRISSPLPEHGDIAGYAAYWKKYYNTVHGAGTEEEFVENYELVKEE
jgi:hypothetical protein